MNGLQRALRRLAPALAVFALLLPGAAALAQMDETVPASDYRPLAGEQFFLLADSSFGSDEPARVRLEAPGRDYRRFELEPYGGVDMRVYRIEQPLQFLQRQPNLHRIRLDGVYQGEGLSNALAYLWDHWYRESRRAMQRSFAYEARREVTAELPELKMGEAIRAPTRFEQQPQFAPIAGLPLVSEFRYPLWEAKPIAPAVDTQLAGSSSDFIGEKEGNVEIPLGHLKPGLYLVEAMIGRFRATTVVFVADTVAITKIAGSELLVWTADKREGRAVPDAQVLWTDGVGLLSRGRTDSRGLLQLSHVSPERSYVLGEDAEGGVFVSENFYYDSEIYDTKLYAFTDRPLYRPGDWVEVKILGREFKSARDSVRAQDGRIELNVLDANGSLLQSLPLAFTGSEGAAGRFQLPDNATAGGYELRFSYREQLYSSAFRVAEYIKPHFEIVLDLDKPEHGTGEPVLGRLSLLYPDGSPVRDAHVQLGLRAQQLSMIDNELQYLGQFPVELSSTELRTDAEGQARIELPAATTPSRYLLTVFASDGAAYRVRSSKEILIERGAAQYRLQAERRFSAVGDTLRLRYSAEGDQRGDAPQRYTWVRLEDRSRGEGALAADADSFELRLPQPGTYNISLLNQHGQILGGTGHAVSGDGVRASPGSIEIVLDQAEYQHGATAEALLTFPQPVAEALLTLERDQVEATALLSAGADWLSLERLNETQFRARIPVTAEFAPNLTFSVLYTQAGEYSFQNAGIKVTMPSIEVAIRPERELYRPGETVTLEFETTRDGKPQPTRLTVSVVDEMIYALQPEIAPTIGEFFFHPRRNNVRTAASLSFISYDVALPGRPSPPPAGNRSERGVKVLERPRREEVDTAAWAPLLQTDAQGRARLSFRMPDSLTRWRITARAVADDGLVGQRRAFIRSEQPLYLKWSGPTQFRAGDAPQLGLLAFNQGSEAVDVELLSRWKGSEQRQPHRLQRGANFLAIDALDTASGGELVAELYQNDQRADALSVDLEALAETWRARSSLSLQPNAASTPLALPADAGEIELRLAVGSAALFRSALDDLIDYPWGCSEQTASRLLPLALALPSLQQASPAQQDRLRLVLANGRLRLMQMAGPSARFSWWGAEGSEDAFLTAYAYYADFHASRALGVALPPGHFERVLQIYSEQADGMAPLKRMLILDFAHAMQLPVKTLLEGALSALAETPMPEQPDTIEVVDSLVFAAPNSAQAHAAATLLGLRLAAELKLEAPPKLAKLAEAAERRLAESALPFAQALRLHRGAADPAAIAAVFAQLAPEQSTLERALALSWLQQAAAAGDSAAAPAPTGDWQRVDGPALEPRWRWTGAQPPTDLAFAQLPGTVLSARIGYDSAASPSSELPVQISRRLWKLVPGSSAFEFSLQAVAADAPLQSSALYLDEIELRNTADGALHYGLVEVPLPPGADVERTTWGLNLVAGSGDVAAPALERARHEPGQLAYALPVDVLVGTASYRHLLRFSQRGEFKLPPARYTRMYQPGQEAWETEPALARVVVE
ncbi:alpha-2-macroglobulin family protein [Aquimonas sp.]|jgi:uncharacterized protein YfaS (alpha-2-macroglobulin family)|uniref:alpha-2-macroglobulin family protein n=1 Tax=Aquimonas sp. TaxID=1872588 RepID=UPI0037BEEC7E